MNWTDLLPPIITAAALGAIAWFFNRNKDDAQVRFTNAQTFNEVIESQASLQAQVVLLSDQMKQQRIDNEREIKAARDGCREEIELIRADYEREIKLLRRRVNRYAQQMRDAGITPVNGDDNGFFS